MEPERLTWMCPTTAKSFQHFTGERRPEASLHFTITQNGMTEVARAERRNVFKAASTGSVLRMKRAETQQQTKLT